MRPFSRPAAKFIVSGLLISASFVTDLPSAKGDTVVTNQPQALEAVISDPRVQAFMHPEISERFPLQVNLPEGVDAEPFAGVDLGVPFIVLVNDAAPDPAKANLIVSTLDLDATSGDIAFTLPIEGLSGSAKMRLENGAWIVNSLELVER